MILRKSCSRLHWCWRISSCTRPSTFEFSLADDGHPVANRFHLAEFMRGKEDCLSFVFQPVNDLPHFHLSDRIQTAGRLIENEQIRVVDQRLGKANPLLHAL